MTTTPYTIAKGDEVATVEPLYVGTVVATDSEWTMVLTYDNQSKRYRTANLVLQKDYEPFPYGPHEFDQLPQVR